MTAPELLTSDGVRLLARHWPATAPVRAAAVLVHGFSASKDAPDVVAVADSLAAMGLDVVGYDARGHGGSGGECTLGDSEHLDVAAAVELARTLSPRVVLVGASMGAIAVLRHAATAVDIAGRVGGEIIGVVSVSSPARWRLPRTMRTLLAAGLTQTPPGRWIAARYLDVRIARGWTRPESPEDLARRLRVPLVVIHGEEDRFIRAAEASMLARAAGGPCRLMVVPDMGHAYDVLALPVVAEAVDWLLAQHDRVASTH